jgi:hypothetical protein
MKIRNSLAWLLALSSAACGGSPTSVVDDVTTVTPSVVNDAGDAGDAGKATPQDSGTSPEASTVGVQPTPDAGAPTDEDASPDEDAGKVDAEPTSEDGGDGGLTMWCVIYISRQVGKSFQCCPADDCPTAYPAYIVTSVPRSDNNVGKPCSETVIGADKNGNAFPLTCEGTEFSNDNGDINLLP